MSVYMGVSKNQGSLIWTPNSVPSNFKDTHKQGLPICRNSHMVVARIYTMAHMDSLGAARLPKQRRPPSGARRLRPRSRGRCVALGAEPPPTRQGWAALKWEN